MRIREFLHIVGRHVCGYAIVAIALLPVAGVCASQRKDITPPSLIPLPVRVDLTPGYFTLRDGAVLSVRSGNAQAIGSARYFADLLARSRGLHLDVRPFDAPEPADGIVFVLDPRFLVHDDPGDEGYELTISSRRILVAARTPHGLFNGSITLWQWLTQDAARGKTFNVPCVYIEDHPRFAWRGLMLDSARHFQSPQFIERLLDQMAQLKLNVFQWHLTDDQGWRIQIKKYPKLTDVGAWRIPASVDGTAPHYGGFYTQDEVREIVRYAAARQITIVPEIEMPGHAQAAIAAYPELGVTGAIPPVSSDWGVHTYLYNVDDATFDFLENVLGEVIELFPGKYIHIGGDEAAKDQWQASAHVQQRMHELGAANEVALQGYFTARIERFLAKHGRSLIGWDEILESALPLNATVMSWQGTKGGIEAARLGHDVVMAPSPQMYFDHVQSELHDEPPGRPDVVSLADVYGYEPAPAELNAAQKHHVLGAQAALWTEYMDTPQRVEHATFPRAAALAEVLWSPQTRRAGPDFLARMPAQLDRYRAAGIDFADSAFAADIRATSDDAKGNVKVEISNQTHFGEIHETLDGAAPTPAAPACHAALTAQLLATVQAAVFAQGRPIAAPRKRSLGALSLLRRNSDELKPCKPGQGLPLRLPGPAAGGGESVYRVDIFDPCWIYPQVDFDAVHAVSINVGERPYNFQLWKDADKVVLRKPATAGGDLQMHLDTCAGEVLATIPLAGKTAANGTAKLDTPLTSRHGLHDLCFQFERATPDPLWMIDAVQLQPQ
jgi:hexosaminidase